MESISAFKQRVKRALSKIDPEILAYNEGEFWMIRMQYEYLEYYAEKKRLYNTAIALPLARGMHNGSYRKLPVMRGGVAHKPPYVIHCLTVCKMLADIPLPLSAEEEDILLASALCHDMIEDMPFEHGGRELTEVFGMDPGVYETVKCVSKRYDFTPEQEQEFFQSIMENRLAVLIKLSDRGHNVTDLFNMSEWKIHEYIGETRTFFLPMCEYARTHYPELEDATEILQNQIICLTKAVECTAEKHAAIRQQLSAELETAKRENEILHGMLKKLREERTHE
ncbi:MAG: hypothetical protein Q4C53_09050 [Clostridia bacterium]|nr:hypothetical protein [Clostridia bacterium]